MHGAWKRQEDKATWATFNKKVKGKAEERKAEGFQR